MFNHSRFAKRQSQPFLIKLNLTLFIKTIIGLAAFPILRLISAGIAFEKNEVKS